jgi:hypothetical protein
MKQEKPVNLLNQWNKDVLSFIEGYSAHGDIAEGLLKAVEPLGDVQSYCPDTSQFRYLVVSTKELYSAWPLECVTLLFDLINHWPIDL